MVKRYGQVEAVRGVDLAVMRGEFLTVLGPSGSGKTTILRLIAGFTVPTEGQILLEGRDVSNMTPAERGIGMVFQHYALFPHMSVADNIGYGLKMRGRSKREREKRVAEMLDLVGLTGMGKRLPRQLSGGQQQRVALARALAFGPSLLLMDEPLGALDRELRIHMAAELRRIHEELRTTVVYVTHDREEALTLSDRIAILHQGMLEAVDTPPTLYTRPSSRFVATFFAGHNVLPARLLGISGTRATVECLGQSVEADACGRVEGAEEVWLVVPAQAIRFSPGGGAALRIDATMIETLYMGDTVRVTCDVESVGRVEAVLPPDEAPKVSLHAPLKLFVDLRRTVVSP
jgi:putative spermidine/putrescine transport system ATP-binding protein